MRQSLNAFRLRPTLVIRCQPLGRVSGSICGSGTRHGRDLGSLEEALTRFVWRLTDLCRYLARVVSPQSPAAILNKPAS